MRSKQGITNTVFISDKSPLKATGDPYHAMTADHAAMFQRYVNSFSDMFINAVATNRGITAGDVNKYYGQGADFFAQQALERGMIDGIAPELPDAIAELKSPGRRAIPGMTAEARLQANPPVSPRIESRALCARLDPDPRGR